MEILTGLTSPTVGSPLHAEGGMCECSDQRVLMVTVNFDTSSIASSGHSVDGCMVHCCIDQNLVESTCTPIHMQREWLYMWDKLTQPTNTTQAHTTSLSVVC